MREFLASDEIRALKGRLTPTDKDRKKVDEIYTESMELLKKNIERMGIEATPSLHGSVAKDTWLAREAVNLDIFVAFSQKYSEEEIKRMGLKVGVLFDHEIAYAEHPYVKNHYRGATIDVVPCFSAERMITSVDRTPLHTKYIASHLSEEQKGEVRLIKKFMKAQHVYGAEQKVGGFSGYLCELLVLRYGDTGGIIEGASHWKRGERLDLEGSSAKKFGEPFVFVDPTDPDRNVAAAVTPVRLSGFIHACRLFSKSPSLRFFFSRKSTFVRNPGSRLFLVEFKCDLIDDILFPQLRKTEKYLTQALAKAGFSVYRSAVFHSGILLELDVFSLPSREKRWGPPIFDEENCARFSEKHPNARAEELNLVSEVKRTHATARSLLRELVRTKEGFGRDLRSSPCRLREVAVPPAYEMF